MMIRSIALLGCGRVAQHYRQFLKPLAEQGRIRVAGCCDTDAAKARSMAEFYGAPAFAGLDVMLAEAKPDILAVLTPSGLHGVHARAGLEAGCHVLVEKPVTLIPEEAQELAELACARGLYYGVAFQNRWNPAMLALKQAMDSGRFGTLVSVAVRLRWCRYQPYYEDGWHGTWAMDGGVICQQAIHHVDALAWVCGLPDAVCATIERRLNRLEAEDTLAAVLRMPGGAVGTIEATTAARPEDFEASLSVVGETGYVQVGGIALNKIDAWRFVEPKPGDEAVPARASVEVPNGYGLSHGPLIEEWLDRLDAGSVSPPVPAEDGVRASLLVHALYASAEGGGWVRLADAPRSRLLGR